MPFGFESTAGQRDETHSDDSRISAKRPGQPLDLNQLLIHHPVATYFVRVEGDAMRGDAILSNDILIVDRSLDPQAGQIVVAAIDGAFLVRRLQREGDRYTLESSNRADPPIALHEGEELQIFGVVTGVVRQFKA